MLTALPYGKGERAKPSRERPVGSIAAFAQKNFYREHAKRLQRYAALLAEARGTDTKAFRVFCNSPLPEKRLAVEAGLGCRGKNSLVIVPGAGSLVVLGGLLFPKDAKIPAGFFAAPEPMKDFSLCGDCDLCRSACPVGALESPGIVDRDRCLQSYAGTFRPLPPEIREAWGSLLYGCGICQDVCPWNETVPPAAETHLGPLGPEVSLATLLAVPDNALRKEIFRGTALDQGWISPLALKRNALVAAAHQQALGLRPLLESYRDRPEEILRETAAWALGRLGP